MDDIYQLAQLYLLTNQHRKAVHLLQSRDLLKGEARFRYLAGQCLAHCKEWDECLAVLGEDDSLFESTSMQARTLIRAPTGAVLAHAREFACACVCVFARERV